jgi:hypothetical protein
MSQTYRWMQLQDLREVSEEVLLEGRVLNMRTTEEFGEEIGNLFRLRWKIYIPT